MKRTIKQADCARCGTPAVYIKQRLCRKCYLAEYQKAYRARNKKPTVKVCALCGRGVTLLWVQAPPTCYACSRKPPALPQE